MTTRLLKVNLGKPLREKMGTTPKTKFARQIGVSPKKLTAMLEDDWNYITRDAIERAADCVELDAAKIFAFEPIEFWKPIQDQEQCTFLRGNQNQTSSQDVEIPVADNNATKVITDFLGDSVPRYRLTDHGRNETELIEQVRSENCIVIGSPKSNAATEILLSRLFEAEPFSASDDERIKIPFGFCWPADNDLAKGSTLTCSANARTKTKDKEGIAIRNGPHVRATYMSNDEYRAWSAKKGKECGKDCGLVFVANKPFGSDRPVKLIVVAGFSGIGTLGAATALIEDFRYLEPYSHEKFVYGVVEVWYSKPSNSSVRTYIDFRWRYRSGGSLPLGVKRKKARKPNSRKRRSR